MADHSGRGVSPGILCLQEENVGLRINRRSDQLESYRDKWMYLLKHMHRMEKLPAEVSKLSKEERMAYEASLKANWDIQNACAYVRVFIKHDARSIFFLILVVIIRSIRWHYQLI